MKLLVLKKSKDYGEKLRKPQERRGDTPGDRLEHFRKLILDHLDTLDGDVMKKAGLPVGTVREWKGGQKYVKVGPNKWRPKYDSESRGAKMAVAAIRRKIAAAKDAHEMMSIVLEHRDRFSGKDGQPLPFVQELHSYVMSAQEGREKAEKKKAVADKKKDKPEEKESGKTGTKDTESDEKSVEEWEQAGADAFKAGKPRKPPYDEIVKTGTKIGSPESKEADKKMKAWLRGWTKADASSELSDKKVKQKNTPLYQTGDYKVKQRGENDFVVTDKDGNVLPHFGIGGKSDTFADIHGAKKHADLRAKLDEDKKNKKMPDPEQLKKLKEAAEAEKNEYNNAFIELYKNGMITEKQAVAKLTNRKNPNRKTVAEARKLLGEDKPMEGGLYDKEKETDAPESGDDNAAAFKAIQEKYRSAKSVTGDEDEIAVGKETLEGKWKLVEADAPAASHDESTFHKTKGFPVDGDGGTVNDRDYEHDDDAKNMVIDIGTDYDMRALSFDNPVVVTQDGIVISGNNRTMSSKIAARKGTDKKYIEALKKRARKFGFSAGDIAKFKNPRIVFEVENKGGYDTGLFAKFNQSSQKAMNPIEKAVKVSKMVKTETVEKIASKISEFDTLGDLYQDTGAITGIFNHFSTDGIIGKMDMPQYVTADGITGAGKEFMETVLIGSVINEQNIRRLNREGCKSIRQKLVRAITPLIENRGMKGYSVSKELNEAVDISMQIATDKNMGSVADFAEQDSFFEKYDPVAIEIAKKLEGTQKSFAAFMQTMNGGLKYAANGEADIFLGGVESREDILARMLNMKKAMGGAIDAAINGALRFFHGLSKGRGSFEREKVILNRAGENIETYRRVAKQAEALPPSDEQVISPDRKKTVAVDFDGVINSYKSGWKGPAETDELVIGAAHALRELFELGHKIIVFSTRANTPEGEETIRDYIMEVTETPEIYNSIEVTDRKPVADVYIDDRAIPFTGDWKETLEQIKNFEPWTKREKSAQISEDEANITQISDDLIDAAGYLHDSENDAKQKLGEVVEAVHALAVAPEEDESKKENKYVFLGLGENGLTLKFSDDINSFEIWNHYGFIPQPEHFEKLEKDGVVGWTGNDTWYYIMQHDTWRYMNLDLSAKIDKSIVEKSLTWSGYPLQGRTKVQGMDISIENKKGSTRSGTDKDGHEWHTEMHFDYGYIRGTVGTDKDHLDAYVGPNPESEIVYIVNQNDPVTGDFDEQKVMLGFNSEAEAKEAYLKQYDRPGFLGSIVKMDIDTFKEKAFDIKNRGKPLKKAVA